MKIYLDTYGNITKVTDNVFVANASGYDNIIAFYFVNDNGNVTTRTDINYCSISVKRSDGFVISRLNAEYVLDSSADVHYWRYEIRENDGILYVKGQLEISAQFVKATIDDSGDNPVITKRETLAVESITAHVKQNIGLAEEDTFNETLEQARLDRDTLQAEITQNANDIADLENAVDDLDDTKAETVLTKIIRIERQPQIESGSLGFFTLTLDDFANSNAKVGDYFWGLVYTGSTNYHYWFVSAKVTGISGTNVTAKYYSIFDFRSPDAFDAYLTALYADSNNSIRNIQWNEEGAAFSIIFTRKDGSTGTVSVPLMALKDAITDVGDRLYLAESEIDTLQSDMNSAESDISTIQGKIPAEATSSNKLADKNFVNSTVATQTANFLATLDAHDDLGLTKPATSSQIVTALNSYSFASKTNNDYCYVINADGIGNTLYDRFKWNASTSTFAYEYTLNNSSFTSSQWTTINSGLTSADKLPEKVNDRYLHTNASTGALEWVEVQGGGGGTGDYDDLDNKPIVNADLDTITPVDGTYYRHTGTGGGGGSATPFVVGQTYNAIYWDTNKTVEEMNALLPDLVDTTLLVIGGIDFSVVSVTYESETNPVYMIVAAGGEVAVYRSAVGGGYTNVGWDNELISAINDEYIEDAEVSQVNNQTFMSATPFGGASTYTTGAIYYYTNGEYKPVFGGGGGTWGSIQGTLTDQQDLVQALNGKVSDVTIGGTSIVSSGVADIPYASTSNAGIIRASSTYGTQVSGMFLQGRTRTYEQYGTDSGTLFVCKGTLDNVITGKNLGENIDIVVDM